MSTICAPRTHASEEVHAHIPAKSESSGKTERVGGESTTALADTGRDRTKTTQVRQCRAPGAPTHVVIVVIGRLEELVWGEQGRHVNALLVLPGEQVHMDAIAHQFALPGKQAHMDAIAQLSLRADGSCRAAWPVPRTRQGT